MEKKDMSGKMEKTMDKGADAMQKTAETIGDTIIQLMDRLAGKKSDLRLTFDDLKFDAQFFNARLNGSIVLDVVVAKELESSTSAM